MPIKCLTNLFLICENSCISKPILIPRRSKPTQQLLKITGTEIFIQIFLL